MHKFHFILVLGFTLFLPQVIAAPESPRIDQPADDNWKFFLGDDPAASSLAYDDSKWQPVTLPHDWSIAGPSLATNPTGGPGGFFPTGLGWYRYELNVPLDWKAKTVILEFEGVYQHAEVFLNGTSVVFHPYGYTSFLADLSKGLKPGEKNIIAVKVDNSLQKNTRWYSGSGIYRHVHLLVMHPVHLNPLGGVYVTTPKADESAATVVVQTEVDNDTTQSAHVKIQSTLLGPDGSTLATFPDVTGDIPVGTGPVLKQEVSLKNPPLWFPEHTQISRILTKVFIQDHLVDQVTTPFGIRQLAWSAETGMTLNGKTYKLCGGCIHHDNGVLGACAFDRAEERKIQILKAAGFNAIRTAHNPPSPELLNACDRLGMLVMDEAFDCWVGGKNSKDYSLFFKEWWDKDIDLMVRRDRNHPSVVLWSIGNEIPGIYSAMGGEYGPKLADRVRASDSSRPVTNGILGWPFRPAKVPAGQPQPAPTPKDLESMKNADLNWNSLDVVGSNYALNSHISQHAQFPKRVLVSTESSPPVGKAYEVLDNTYVIGDFVWSAQDYLGECGVGRWFYKGDPTEPLGPPSKEHPDQPGGPVMHGNDKLFPWRGANSGDVDLLGNIKPAAHLRNIIWGAGEKLALAVRQPEDEGKIVVVGWGWFPTWESWTWPGREGKSTDVEVYSRYPKVRLYLNDQLIGEHDTTRGQNYRAQFTLPYQPGTLKAVGVENDKEVESKILVTTGAASGLRLTPDRKEIAADAQDLSFVTVEAVDDKGQLQPNADHEISFTLSGPGSIAGLGNAWLKSTESYQGTTCHLYHGKALLVIRSSHTAGTITLTAKTPSLSSAETRIEAK